MLKLAGAAALVVLAMVLDPPLTLITPYALAAFAVMAAWWIRGPTGNLLFVFAGIDSVPTGGVNLMTRFSGISMLSANSIAGNRRQRAYRYTEWGVQTTPGRVRPALRGICAHIADTLTALTTPRNPALLRT